MMRWIVTIVGGLASIALVGLSMAINWSFGWTLGASQNASIIYAVMGVALDGLKLAIPFIVYRAWCNGGFVSILAASLIWCGCSFISFSSAVGYAALNRSINQDIRTVMATSRQSVLSELSRHQMLLGSMPMHRALPVVQRAIGAHESNPLWLRTSHCQDATVSRSITFCETHRELAAELAAAQSATEIGAKIDRLRRDLDRGIKKPLQAANPQLSMLARLADIEVGSAQDVIVVVLAGLLELASSFGLFLTVRFHHEATRTDDKNADAIEGPHVELPTPQNLNSISQFLEDRICAEMGARVDGSDLYAAYTQWAAEHSAKPMTQTRFGTWIRENTNIGKVTAGGRVRYLDVELI